ncbi:beta strand repeat-containing protein, partial [Caenispirillum salinarum]|uniref:beta strand repeat-containing protein n=1 Tax=Caenispirillum salinarum TaxID=859058 RepID=UPI001F1D4B06
MTYTINLLGGNANPTVAGLPTDVAVTEETASNLDLSAATVSDDDAADILTVTLTANSGTMTASSGGSVTVGGSTTGTLTLTGTAANIDTYLNTASNIQYTGASNVSGDNAATVTVTVQDNAGSPVVNAGTVNLDITDINDAPTVSANASQPTGGFTEGGAAQQLFNLDSISTIESTQTVSSFAFSVGGLQDAASEVVTIGGQDFALNGSGGTVSGHNVSISGGTVTVTFGTGQSTANAVSFIDAITYKNTSENPTGGNRTFTLNAVRDSGGTVGTGAADTVNPNLVRTIGVTAVNDDPTATGLPGGPIAAPEETATNIDLSALTLSDVDGDTTVTLKLGVTNGTLAASTDGGVTVGGTGTAMTLTGTVSAINAYLDTASRIQYTGNTNHVGADTLTVAVTDNGNTGTGGGGDVALGNITLNVTNLNDDPTLTGLPSDVTVTEDQGSNLDLSAVTLGDVDPSDTLTVTLTASAGTMAATTGGGVTVGGTGTGTLTLSGLASDIDTFLNTASNIQYTGASNVNGDNAATIAVTVNDGAGSGDINAGTVNIDITAVNDDPTATGLPAGPIAAPEETAINIDLSSLALSDVDGDTTVTLKLGVSNGTLSATGVAGVTVGGSATALTLTGTVSALNTYLDTTTNITYTGNTNYAGTDTLTVAVTDNGNTGTGGGGDVALGTITLNVTNLNDNPTLTGLPSDVTVTEDVASNLDLTAVTLGDVDPSDTLTVTLTASAGTMAATTGGGVTVGGTGTGTLTLQGSAAAIDTFLNTASNIQYTGASNVNGDNAATIAVTVNDGA